MAGKLTPPTVNVNAKVVVETGRESQRPAEIPLTMLIGTKNDNVFLQFGIPIYFLEMPPEDAIEFAKQVTEKANEIIEGKGP